MNDQIFKLIFKKSFLWFLNFFIVFSLFSFNNLQIVLAKGNSDTPPNPVSPSSTSLFLPTTYLNSSSSTTQSIDRKLKLNCPIGAGLSNDTFSIQQTYQASGRLYIIKNIDTAQKYFPQLTKGIRALSATSYDGLQQLASQAKQLGIPYEALSYDIEAWQQSPTTEQTDLVGSTQKASKLAHSYGKLLIMGPGLNLMTKPAHVNDYSKMAPYTDIWMIQSQAFQLNLPAGPSYRQEIQKITNQIRTGNQRTLIWVQISVTPGQGTQILNADGVLAYRNSILDLIDGTFIFDTFDPNHPQTLTEIFTKVCGTP
jgi:hypothetical protein